MPAQLPSNPSELAASHMPSSRIADSPLSWTAPRVHCIVPPKQHIVPCPTYIPSAARYMVPWLMPRSCQLLSPNFPLVLVVSSPSFSVQLDGVELILQCSAPLQQGKS